MRVTLTPYAGQHEIAVDHIVLKTTAEVDEQIRYLRTVRDMLWRKEKAANARPASQDD